MFITFIRKQLSSKWMKENYLVTFSSCIFIPFLFSFFMFYVLNRQYMHLVQNSKDLR